MTFEGNGSETAVPPHRSLPHYHGDEVKGLLVFIAFVIIVAQSTGADLPLSTWGAVGSAVVLVVVAGITNPKQVWIHWMSEAIAFVGTLVFGNAAVTHYRVGGSLLDSSFAYTEALALLFLLTLYFATRTIRGIYLRPRRLS